MDRAEAEQRILQRGWLSEQPKEIRAAVLKNARLVQLAAGEPIFHAGDEKGGICGVVSGGVGVYLPSGNTEFRLSHIGRCGLWFGYGPLIRGRHRSLTFNPTEPSWLMRMPLPALQKIAGTSLAHQRAILSVGEYGMDAAITIVDSLLIRNHARRIAATLLRVMNEPDEIGLPGVSDILLTQTQIGEMASVGRQVVNRELQRMEAKGWLAVSYNRITVMSRDALARFAQGG
jgi:CRP-like cAMP-binding protein